VGGGVAGEGHKNMAPNLLVHWDCGYISSSLHIQGLWPHGPFQSQHYSPEVP